MLKSICATVLNELSTCIIFAITMSDTLSRRITFYPIKRYQMLITALAFTKIQAKSDIMEEIARQYFDSMPEKDTRALLDIYRQMTDEQRKNPKKRK